MKRFARLLPLLAILPLCAQDASLPGPGRPDGAAREASTLEAFGMAIPSLMSENRPDSPVAWILAAYRNLVALDSGMGHAIEPLPSVYNPGTFLDRPRLRARLRIVLPGLALKPCVGFEATFPLVFPVNDPAAQVSVFRLLDPKAEVGVYGGIQF